MPVKKVKSSPLPDRVLDCAGQIVALIRTGDIVRHRRIGESSLASTLKVSRAIVRSALEHLEIAGLMTRVPRSGTFLREISVNEFCDVMDIRAALETLATRLAATRGTEPELKALAAQAKRVDLLSRHFADGDITVILDLVQRDLDFHLAVAEMSGNIRLAATLKQQRLIEFTFAMIKENMPFRAHKARPIPTHSDIAEAISAHNPEKAEHLMRQHILRTKEARLGVYTGETA